jgi:hypothetical protein
MYMADKIIVINANIAPNVKLTNMEIKIMAIIAPMNPAITLNFYPILVVTRYTLLVSTASMIVTPHRYH